MMKVTPQCRKFLLIISLRNFHSTHYKAKAVDFAATWRTDPLLPFFKPKNTFLKSTNVIFNIITYTHSFCNFNLKNPLKMGIQENNLYIIHTHKYL